MKKVIVPPKHTVWVPVMSSFNSCNTQFLFHPDTHESSTCSYQSIVTADSISKGKFNKNHSTEFSIPVTNNSEESVYINKNTFLGLIHEMHKCKKM